MGPGPAPKSSPSLSFVKFASTASTTGVKKFKYLGSFMSLLCKRYLSFSASFVMW